MTQPFPVPPQDYVTNIPEWCRKIALSVKLLLDGHMNSLGTVTLTASATETTVTDKRISPQSRFVWNPLTNNAATALTSMYIISRTSGSAVIGHASSDATDLTFDYTLVG